MAGLAQQQNVRLRALIEIRDRDDDATTEAPLEEHLHVIAAPAIGIAAAGPDFIQWACWRTVEALRDRRRWRRWLGGGVLLLREAREVERRHLPLDGRRGRLACVGRHKKRGFSVDHRLLASVSALLRRVAAGVLHVRISRGVLALLVLLLFLFFCLSFFFPTFSRARGVDVVFLSCSAVAAVKARVELLDDSGRARCVLSFCNESIGICGWPML